MHFIIAPLSSDTIWLCWTTSTTSNACQ